MMPWRSRPASMKRADRCSEVYRVKGAGRVVNSAFVIFINTQKPLEAVFGFISQFDFECMA